MIGDETGRVLGSGRGGPCNHVKGPEGRPKFINAIGGCISAAALEANLDPANIEFEAACSASAEAPRIRKRFWTRF